MKKTPPATPRTQKAALPFGAVATTDGYYRGKDSRIAALLVILKAARRARMPAILEAEALAVAVDAAETALRVERARWILCTGSEVAWLRAQRNAIFGKPRRGRWRDFERRRWRYLRDVERLDERAALARFKSGGKFNSLAAAARYLRRVGEPDAPAGYDY